MAVFTVILLVLLSMTSSVANIWRSSTGKIEQFRNARNGFEALTRRLSQATLNTYWDYDDASAPTAYLRQSELRFISGRNSGNAPLLPPDAASKTVLNAGSHAIFFQAPLGISSTSAGLRDLNQLLNTCGYFISFGSDKSYRPDFFSTSVKEKYRFRLIEMIEPSEQLALYNYTSGKDKYGYYPNASAPKKTSVNATIYVSAATPGTFPQAPAPPTGYTGKEWFTEPLNYTDPATPASHPYNRVLADNIIALVILAKLSDQEDSTGIKLAPKYDYDSSGMNVDPAINPKSQLPPIVRVTMVALDESSAARLDKGSATPPGAADLGADISNLFKDASQFSTDLATLEAGLQSKKLQYRVFTIEVAIKGAKWSRVN